MCPTSSTTLVITSVTMTVARCARPDFTDLGWEIATQARDSQVFYEVFRRKLSRYLYARQELVCSHAKDL
jgi:hypothetical protein